MEGPYVECTLLSDKTTSNPRGFTINILLHRVTDSKWAEIDLQGQGIHEFLGDIVPFLA